MNRLKTYRERLLERISQVRNSACNGDTRITLNGNPIHDALGRFASKEGANDITTKIAIASSNSALLSKNKAMHQRAANDHNKASEYQSSRGNEDIAGLHRELADLHTEKSNGIKAFSKPSIPVNKVPTITPGSKPTPQAISEALRKKDKELRTDPSLKDIYDELKKNHPSMLVDDFKSRIIEEHKAGRLSLGAWGGAVDRIPKEDKPFTITDKDLGQKATTEGREEPFHYVQITSKTP